MLTDLAVSTELFRTVWPWRDLTGFGVSFSTLVWSTYEPWRR
jgi:hypothetical protein